VNDALRRRLAEIAARGRTEPPFSPEEVMEKVRAIAERGRPDPPLSYEEVMYRVREIARNGISIEDDDSKKQ
jgi:hypothetical protein